LSTVVLDQTYPVPVNKILRTDTRPVANVAAKQTTRKRLVEEREVSGNGIQAFQALPTHSTPPVRNALLHTMRNELSSSKTCSTVKIALFNKKLCMSFARNY
jgi:hypothetical protein